MRINLERLFSDPPYVPGRNTAWYDALTVSSHGCSLYGEIYLPDGEYGGLRPCVCLFHGFPGVVTSDDLAQALRRIGCVVIRQHHRGAWSSEGFYSFTNNVEDAVVTAQWAAGPEGRAFSIDPDRIFLAGISMGGSTVLNAARQLSWIRGAIAMAPYNLALPFRSHREEAFREILKVGYNLRQETPASLFENARDHWAELDYERAAGELSERSLLLLGGTLDTLAPPEQMLQPLWERLQAMPSAARHDLILYDTTHGFCNSRIRLTTDIGRWLAEICE